MLKKDCSDSHLCSWTLSEFMVTLVAPFCSLNVGRFTLQQPQPMLYEIRSLFGQFPFFVMLKVKKYCLKIQTSMY